MNVRVFLIPAMATLCSLGCAAQQDCPPKGYILLPIDDGNVILDSLEARGDWQGIAVYWRVQVENEQQHFKSDSTTSSMGMRLCDSTLTATREQYRTTIKENEDCQAARKVNGGLWKVFLVTTLILVAAGLH